VVTKGG